MPENHTIKHANGVTTIRLTRKLSLDDVLQVLDEVARTETSNRRLWDVTGQVDLSTQELKQIAARARALWPGAARVAYVAADPLSFGLLRMFEVFQEQSEVSQQQEEYSTKVFREPGAARAWLEAWVE